MPSEKRRVDLSAPVLPFEYPWTADDVIWPCTECLPWHVELFVSPGLEDLWVREWHAVGCPLVAAVEGDREV